MAANRNGFLTIVLCGLLLGSAVMETCEGSSFPWPLKTRHVQVANEFLDELLNVHCRSKDNFEWKFKVNFFLTTLSLLLRPVVEPGVQVRRGLRRQ